MIYQILFHPDVLHGDLEDVDRKFLTQIRKAIEQKLITAPTTYGLPLRHNLKGYWKLRVGDFRVIFRIVENEVRIVMIRHRKDVYQRVAKRLPF